MFDRDRLRRMLIEMASTGTAPEEGCSLFGVGYDDALERIKQLYLMEFFDRGDSAEKFVVGPFGSGKTHFLNQLLEMSREVVCATAKINLNKEIDYTKGMQIYRELVREIRPTPAPKKGLSFLLKTALTRIAGEAPDQASQEDRLRAWMDQYEADYYELYEFGRILHTALLALIRRDRERYEEALRWLSGAIDEARLAKSLGVPRFGSAELDRLSRRMMFSLFQFIKAAGFRGTVVGFDEAEQGLNVSSTKMHKILSALMSGINAVNALRNGAAFIVYAITPDLADRLRQFPALQQRLVPPSPEQHFFAGNTLAPIIDLTMRREATEDLRAIGLRLYDLAARVFHDELPQSWSREAGRAEIERLARETVREDLSAGNRRLMVKKTCTYILHSILGEATALSEVAASISGLEEDDEV